jgi:hypothetical protein
MQSPTFTNDELTRHYTTAIDALYEIARSYFFFGQLGDALHMLYTSLQTTEADEVAQKDRLKLLLLCGRVNFKSNPQLWAGRPIEVAPKQRL